MKRLGLIIMGILICLAMAAVGCSNKGLISASEEDGQELVSSCVTCHTDKDTLKELATEVEEVQSEETTGEG
jgi:cytochrome c553